MKYFTLTPYLPYNGDEDYWTTLLKKISVEFGIEEFDTTLINYGGHGSFEIMSDEKTVSDICARYNMSYHASGDRETLCSPRTITRFPQKLSGFADLITVSFDEVRTHKKVTELAHQLWIERGCPIGSPEVDWNEARRRLFPAEKIGVGVINPKGLVILPPIPGREDETQCEFCGKYDHDDGGCNVYTMED